MPTKIEQKYFFARLENSISLVLSISWASPSKECGFFPWKFFVFLGRKNIFDFTFRLNLASPNWVENRPFSKIRTILFQKSTVCRYRRRSLTGLITFFYWFTGLSPRANRHIKNKLSRHAPPHPASISRLFICIYRWWAPVYDGLLYIYQSSLLSKLLEFIYWTVAIFIFDGVTVQTTHR